MNAIEKLNLKALPKKLQDALTIAHVFLGDGESFNEIRLALLQGEADAKELAELKRRPTFEDAITATPIVNIYATTNPKRMQLSNPSSQKPPRSEKRWKTGCMPTERIWSLTTVANIHTTLSPNFSQR